MNLEQNLFGTLNVPSNVTDILDLNTKNEVSTNPKNLGYTVQDAVYFVIVKGLCSQGPLSDFQCLFMTEFVQNG